MNLQDILQNSKTFEDIAMRRDIGFSEILRAMDIVKEFIINKKRILYGGMAIDFNLKEAGHQGIYQENSIPDYDFMSPDFYEDSNELAVILHKAGFKDISSINAIHISTRRVRIDFVAIADITYIPENIYKTLPYIQSGKFRTIHPDFQRLDMHRAFSIPLEKPPMEVFGFRTKKDQHRFRLLNSQYPIKSPVLENPRPLKMQIGTKYLKNNAIGGFAAYAVLYTEIKKLMENKHVKPIIIPEIQSKFNLIIPGSYNKTEANFGVQIDKIPKGQNIMMNIITDNFDELLQSFPDSLRKTATYYNKYVDDWRPRTICISVTDTDTANMNADTTNTVEIFDNKGKLLPVYEIDKLIVSAPQYVLMYFMQKYFETSHEWYKAYYVSLMGIVEVAELILIQMKFAIDSAITQKQKKIELTMDQFMDFYRSLPFFLTANTYGKYNWSTDFIDNIIGNTYRIRQVPQEERVQTRPDMGFYPDKMQTWNKFEPKKSMFFEFDGLKRDQPFKPVMLDLPT